ncbi:MAG: sugar transferase [Sedimentisphaerales bacterium]|nr:sugar transferase [Sedimentisphaerales bacterium]
MYQCIKRLFDFIASAIASVVLLPLFIIIWAAIRLGSRGPAIFKQERAGKNGAGFTFYKFRTMRTDVDPFGPSPKSGEDVRLTKIGIVLREYSLDELPQLINVLKGDMSIVGPRPLYIAQMAEWNERQKRRLLVKPGLTGLAQISGRGELTIEEKLDLDVKYVDSAGFWLDMKIIFATAVMVFAKKSIYEKNYSQKEQTRGDKSSKF